MPSAPKRSISFAVLIKSGILPPLAFRKVAILLIFTLSFVTNKLHCKVTNMRKSNFVYLIILLASKKFKGDSFYYLCFVIEEE